MRFLKLLLLLPALPAFAQDPRITEFLATNTNGLKDEDNSFQGWVEIWNAHQTNTVSMNGWKLVSDATTWTFPNIQIPPDERIYVWASGKNRINPEKRLHTNFTLPAAGGTLQLRRNTDNALISQFAAFPAQTANVSYGRDETDIAATPTQVGFYNTPTPGERNNYSGSGVAGKVVFDKGSRAFVTTPTFQVSLSLATPAADAEIRYTLNGTMPTATSAKYVNPITVASTQVIRARVFQPGKLPGEIETNGYLLLNSTTSGFNTGMPLMVVSNFGGLTPPPTTDQAAFVWLWEPAAPDGKARFTNLPTLASRVVIDKRGSSTLDNAKYNVNVEFRKGRDDDDRNVTPFGMASGSDYILTGPFDFDRALIRNPFVYNLSRSIKRYAPDTRLVEVFFDVNGGALNLTGTNQSDNDNYGIYNFVEKIRRDKERVNILKLDTYDNDNIDSTRKTGGYIFKVDRLDSGDTGFSAGGQSMAYYYPKENEIRTPQRAQQLAYLSSYITSFKTALDSASWKDPATGYAAWLDVPAAIDHHLINVWTMNVDALRLSGYWHKERGGKLVPGPVWDFDRTIESDDPRDNNPLSWRATSGDLGTDFFNYVWWNRLFLDPDFYQKYIDRWVELRRGAFSQTTVNALMDTLNAQMPSEAVARDLLRWGKSKRTSTFTGAPNTYTGTQASEIQRMKDWMQVRATWMETQWVTPVTLGHPGGNVSVGQTVTMTGPAGATIYYTTDGTDPRPSGGGVPSGGNVFTYSAGSPPVINSTKRIRARAYHPTWTALTGANNPPLVSKWSGPTEARYSTDTPAAAGNLAITELSYHPSNPTAGELMMNPSWTDSDFEYVELKNISNTPIDLGGVHFTDGITYSFTGDQAMTLGVGQLVVIAANPIAFLTRHGSVANLVGPFSGDLSNSSETLILQSATNVDILNFTYSDSWYPTTDGSGRTLVIYNSSAPNAAYSTAANWRASTVLTGSPGANEPNFAPTPNAGPDLTGNLPSINVSGVLNDDNLPNGNNTLTASWSKLTGPGTVDFAHPIFLSTTATFSLPGVYNLRLSASDSVLTGTDDVTVTMRDTPSAWLQRNPGIGTLNDDFDGDGRTNYYEWALLLNPSQNAAGDGSSIAVINDRLTLTYQRQKNSPFVTYTVQVTGDVTAWADPQPGDVTEAILADDGVVQTVRVTDNTTMSSQAKRFIRLKIVPIQ